MWIKRGQMDVTTLGAGRNDCATVRASLFIEAATIVFNEQNRKQVCHQR